MSLLIELTGQKFGRLTVLRQVKVNNQKHGHWLCQCTCGNLTTVRSGHLRNGGVKSCGCLRGNGKGYMSTHRKVAGNKPRPELCERCRERPATELSYDHSLPEAQSFNPDAYEWLCNSCHQLKDRGDKTIMTKARIHRVREFYKCKAATQQELADLFKVSRGTVANIVHCRGVYKNIERR